MLIYITARVRGTSSSFSAVPASPLPLSVVASLPRLFFPFFPDAGAFGVVLPPLLAETWSYRHNEIMHETSDMQPYWQKFCITDFRIHSRFINNDQKLFISFMFHRGSWNAKSIKIFGRYWQIQPWKYIRQSEYIRWI